MIIYNIFKSQCADFERALDILLGNIQEDTVPVRLVFFGNPADNEMYMQQLELIAKAVDKRWGARSPVFSYAAQRPLDAELTMEVQTADEAFAKAVRYSRAAAGESYIVIDSLPEKILLTGGILPSDIDAPILRQSREVLSTVGDILRAENMPLDTIVRQWNYIENITMIDGGSQHYQDFNDARSALYSQSKWEDGYPAATGIGTSAGGIMVEIDATAFEDRKCRAVSLDNELQVAAHEYSQQVLVGGSAGECHTRTTPKFERAKVIVVNDETKIIYISGTAAIRGEESLIDVGIEKQTVATLENIESLVSRKNLEAHKVIMEKDPKIQIFRVYLKFEKDLNAARDIIEKRYPGLPVLYVLSDVCRDELLVEIEGVAN